MEIRIVKQLLEELNWLVESTQGKEEKKETPVTDKQRNYIYALANRAGFGKEALEKLVKQLTGKDSLAECTKGEASEVINTLSEVVKKKSRGGKE